MYSSHIKIPQNKHYARLREQNSDSNKRLSYNTSSRPISEHEGEIIPLSAQTTVPLILHAFLGEKFSEDH